MLVCKDLHTFALLHDQVSWCCASNTLLYFDVVSDVYSEVSSEVGSEVYLKLISEVGSEVDSESFVCVCEFVFVFAMGIGSRIYA